MRVDIKREIKILLFFIILGFLLYSDSTAVKRWRYPLELSPQNKKIEQAVSLILIYYGYLIFAGLRFLIYLIKKFIRYISR